MGAIGIPGAAGTTSEFGCRWQRRRAVLRSLPDINQTAQGILEANDPRFGSYAVGACKTRLPQISIAR
ncbi:hypothetical protein JS565_03655 [Salmonella enterica subsp. enterica serovar Senftenberg]|nr:hypothetical protein [Salmonella enterica subsp. enterica serovar Senftenberg]